MGKEKSIKQRLYEYLMLCYKTHPQVYIHGGWIEKQVAEYAEKYPSKQFKPSTASRRLRELADSGLIQRKENNKGQVEYRFMPNLTTFNKIVLDNNWKDRGVLEIE